MAADGALIMTEGIYILKIRTAAWPIGSEEMKDEIERQNLRLMRAQEFAAALMMEIGDVLESDFDRNARRAVHDRLIDVLYRNGACFTTDEERQKIGLEPRDELGWTPSERVDYEKKRIEALQLMAAAPFVFPSDPDHR